MVRSLTSLVALAGLAWVASPAVAVSRPGVDARTGNRVDVPITDPASHVNLFIGTTSSGHAFPGMCHTLSSVFLPPAEILVGLGVTLPHGMVKVGIDTDSPDNVRKATRLLSSMVLNTLYSMQVTTPTPRSR